MSQSLFVILASRFPFVFLFIIQIFILGWLGGFTTPCLGLSPLLFPHPFFVLISDQQQEESAIRWQYTVGLDGSQRGVEQAVISGYRKRPAPKENPEAREFALRGLLLREQDSNLQPCG
jgi:hypothetical protein